MLPFLFSHALFTDEQLAETPMSGQGAENRAGQGGFQAGKDSQPQVTTAELGAMVGQSLDCTLDSTQATKTISQEGRIGSDAPETTARATTRSPS